MRLIDADKINFKWVNGIICVEPKDIKKMPTVDAEPVRHGAWLPCDKKGYILTETALRDGRRWYGYKCSECNDIYHGNAFTKYCPTCGAKMDGTERKEK